jgi:hypothetical protein
VRNLRFRLFPTDISHKGHKEHKESSRGETGCFGASFVEFDPVPAEDEVLA